MGRVQILLLGLVAVALTALMIFTWGSVGSAMCAFLLITRVAAGLYRRFVLERDEDDFQFDN